MATIPTKTIKSNTTTADILNAVRNSPNMPEAYRSLAPVADLTDQGTVQKIGTVLYHNPNLRNSFFNDLCNMIILTIINFHLFRNPLEIFKRGLLDVGETVREIFIRLAEPHQFDQPKSETNFMKRESAEVLSFYHVLNYQTYYKQTITNDVIKTAFVSFAGVEELISGLINNIYVSASTDEYNVTKYMIACALLNGDLVTVGVPSVASGEIKTVIATVKATSNDMEFMSENFNALGVETVTAKDKKYYLINTHFDASMEVDVLASMFNVDRADFIGRKILIDSFKNMNLTRIQKLLGDGYTPISTADIATLEKLDLILLDREWFMIFDNLQQFTENYNGEGLYWQNWYHVWKTLSYSLVKNAVAFIEGTPTVTAVTISPATATVNAGTELQLYPKVTGTNLPYGGVVWSTSNEACTVNIKGVLNIPKGTTGSVTVTATSKVDPTKSGTATITIGGGVQPDNGGDDET